MAILDKLVSVAPVLAAAAAQDDPPLSQAWRIGVSVGVLAISVVFVALLIFSK